MINITMNTEASPYKRVVDDSGRVVLPVRCRQRGLGMTGRASYTVTRGLDRAVLLYTLERWIEMEERISYVSIYNLEQRCFSRRILMWAEEVVIDAKGRVPIPRLLMEFAEIERDVLIIDAGSHLALWNPHIYHDVIEANDALYTSVAERMWKDI